ncbi:hypothetical protein HDU96_010689 [Phlyctochytrium bullatum]|nr:hypothetical protein HDU96_010689 [Phlyctochytrium bullatum]
MNQSLAAGLARLPSELRQSIFSVLDDLALAIEVEWFFRLAQFDRGTVVTESIAMFDNWTDSDVDKAYFVPYLSLSPAETQGWNFRTMVWVLRFRPQDANTFEFGNLAASRGWVAVLEKILQQSTFMSSTDVAGLLPATAGKLDGVDVARRFAKLSPDTLKLAAAAKQLDAVKFLTTKCGLFVSATVINEDIGEDVARYVIEVIRRRTASDDSDDVFRAVCKALQHPSNSDDFVEWCMAIPEVTRKLATRLYWKRKFARSLAWGGHVKALNSLISTDPEIVDNSRETDFYPTEGHFYVVDAMNSSKDSCSEDIKDLLETLSHLPFGLKQRSGAFYTGSGTRITVDALNLLEKYFTLEIDEFHQFAFTILEIAAEFGRPNLVEWLFARRDFDETDFNYDSAVSVAAGHGSLEIIQFLLEKTRRCQMKYAIKHALSSNIDVALYLLDIKQRYPERCVECDISPYHVLLQAVEVGSTDAVEALLRIYPEVDRSKAIDFAMKRGHLNILKLLANAKTDYEVVRSMSSAAKLKGFKSSVMEGNRNLAEVFLHADGFTRTQLAEAATVALEHGYLGLAIDIIRAHDASKEPGKPFEVLPSCLTKAVEKGYCHVVRFVLDLDQWPPNDPKLSVQPNREHLFRSAALLAFEKNQLDSLSAILETPNLAEMVDMIKQMFIEVNFTNSFSVAWYLHRRLRDAVGSHEARESELQLMNKSSIDDFKEHLKQQLSVP